MRQDNPFRLVEKQYIPLDLIGSLRFKSSDGKRVCASRMIADRKSPLSASPESSGHKSWFRRGAGGYPFFPTVPQRMSVLMAVLNKTNFLRLNLSTFFLVLPCLQKQMPCRNWL